MTLPRALCAPQPGLNRGGRREGETKETSALDTLFSCVGIRQTRLARTEVQRLRLQRFKVAGAGFGTYAFESGYGIYNSSKKNLRWTRSFLALGSAKHGLSVQKCSGCGYRVFKYQAQTLARMPLNLGTV